MLIISAIHYADNSVLLCSALARELRVRGQGDVADALSEAVRAVVGVPQGEQVQGEPLEASAAAAQATADIKNGDATAAVMPDDSVRIGVDQPLPRSAAIHSDIHWHDAASQLPATPGPSASTSVVASRPEQDDQLAKLVEFVDSTVQDVGRASELDDEPASINTSESLVDDAQDEALPTSTPSIASSSPAVPQSEVTALPSLMQTKAEEGGAAALNNTAALTTSPTGSHGQEPLASEEPAQMVQDSALKDTSPTPAATSSTLPKATGHLHASLPIVPTAPAAAYPAAVAALKAEGRAAFILGQYAQALALYQQAEGELVDDAAMTNHRCTLLTNQATCALKLGQPRQAHEASSQALALEDRNVKVRRCFS
jgi:hypothetical protein